MLVLQQVVHSSSVDIRPEWAVVEQIPFTSLSKLNYQVKMLSQRAALGQDCNYWIQAAVLLLLPLPPASDVLSADMQRSSMHSIAQPLAAHLCSMRTPQLQNGRCSMVWQAERPLALQAPPPDTLDTYGTLEYFDKAFDRVTPKTEKPLRKTRRAFRNVTTSDDPIIRQGAATEALPLL